jgi:fido (protein-threonine AMPylation protein)
MLRLAKGTRATRAFVDEVARELGRNVVWAAADLDRAAPEVRVDADRELDALAYEDAATALLWQAGVQITGLSQHVAPIVATLLAAEAAAAR